MKQRILTLQAEIKNVESVLSSLSGAAHYQVSEELKNMRFEMDMLKRSIQKSNNLQLPVQQVVAHQF